MSFAADALTQRGFFVCGAPGLDVHQVWGRCGMHAAAALIGVSIVPRTIAIIQGHPDPSGRRLCHALADAYADGAAQAGHKVLRIDVARLDFPLLKSKEEFEKGALPSSLAAARDAITAADHLVTLFPLWLGAQPAILKGFLEQVARPGVAFAYQDKAMPKKLWAGKSARLVVTMGMPGVIYRLFYRSHGLKALRRNVFEFVGIKPVRESVLGMVEGQKPARIQAWLDEMRRLGAQAA